AGRGGDARRARLARLAVAVAAAVALVRLASGIGFWPGLLATTPLAAVGLARGWGDPARRLVLGFALVPIPLVLAFQDTGGALPQWGGRYLLTTGFLLAVVGVSCLPDLEVWARRAAVGAAVVITALGLAWLNVRSYQVADAL